MRLRALTFAMTGLFISIGPVLAYHPVDRSIRGTLDPEQLEIIERDHVQSGWLVGRPSTAVVRRPVRTPQRRAGPVPFPTEHHTR